VLNYLGLSSLTPAEAAASASRMLRFFDLGGHERFSKTLLHGLTAMLPDHVLLCVSAVAGALLWAWGCCVCGGGLVRVMGGREGGGWVGGNWCRAVWLCLCRLQSALLCVTGGRGEGRPMLKGGRGGCELLHGRPS
jgi:hypothetical protein